MVVAIVADMATVVVIATFETEVESIVAVGRKGGVVMLVMMVAPMDRHQASGPARSKVS